MTRLHFAQIIEIRDGNPYVLVAKDQAEQLQASWRKPMPVLVQVNQKPDKPWHINMMPAGNGDFYLYLHGDVRKASQTRVGDLVTLDVTFDNAYQNGPQDPIPQWFQDALDNNIDMSNNWNALPPSRQKEILRYFAHLVSDEAKQRNLEKAILVLSGHPGRFMARSWENGK